MTRIVIPKEWQEQVALVEWLRYHPQLKKLFLKNDNEGKRTPAQGFQAKRMGLRPGASDLFIAWPTMLHPGLWLEVKRNKRYTKSEMSTPSWLAQIEFIEDMKSVGYAGEFCYGWIDGKRIIESYLLASL
jgi:hypothetical protein